MRDIQKSSFEFRIFSDRQQKQRMGIIGGQRGRDDCVEHRKSYIHNKTVDCLSHAERMVRAIAPHFSFGVIPRSRKDPHPSSTRTFANSTYLSSWDQWGLNVTTSVDGEGNGLGVNWNKTSLRVSKAKRYPWRSNTRSMSRSIPFSCGTPVKRRSTSKTRQMSSSLTNVPSRLWIPMMAGPMCFWNWIVANISIAKIKFHDLVPEQHGVKEYPLQAQTQRDSAIAFPPWARARTATWLSASYRSHD